MSSVRMCDKCGTIFSENDDGWSSTNGAVQRRRENGTRYAEQVTKDFCARCMGNGEQPAPRLPTQAAIGAGTPGSPGSSPAEQDMDHYRLAELERTVNELRWPGATVPGTITTAAPVTPDDQIGGSQ